MRITNHVQKYWNLLLMISCFALASIYAYRICLLGDQYEQVIFIYGAAKPLWFTGWIVGNGLLWLLIRKTLNPVYIFVIDIAVAVGILIAAYIQNAAFVEQYGLKTSFAYAWADVSVAGPLAIFITLAFIYTLLVVDQLVSLARQKKIQDT